jgi:hypothetical protein
MRSILASAAVLIFPLIFASGAVAADKEAPVNKPSLTYYFFDG